MITLIQDATAIGESEPTSIISGSDTGQDIHSFQVATLGSPTAVTISILGTIDGTNYSCLLQHELSADEITDGLAMFHLINKPVPRIKASVDVLTGGVSPEVSVYYFKGSVST